VRTAAILRWATAGTVQEIGKLGGIRGNVCGLDFDSVYPIIAEIVCVPKHGARLKLQVTKPETRGVVILRFGMRSLETAAVELELIEVVVVPGEEKLDYSVQLM
jgi:hypothetical protein